MQRELTPLEIQIVYELPNNAATVARRLNKQQPNVYRVLQRLVEHGLVSKDEDKIYHWERIFPLPEKPAELKSVELPAYVNIFENAWKAEPDAYTPKDMDTMLEYVNKNGNIAATVAFYLVQIMEAQS